MELVTIVLGVALLLLSTLVIAKYGAKRRRFVTMVDRLPGPRSYPIIGTVMRVVMAPRYRFLEMVNADVQEFNGFYRSWFGPTELIHIAKPEHLEVVLNNMTHITKGWLYDLLQSWLGQGLLTSNGSKWHTHRKLITPAFHFKILEAFFDVFAEQSQVLVEKLKHKSDVCGDKGFNIYPFITLCTLDIICETAMGVKIQAQETTDSEYVQAVNDIGNIMFERVFRPWVHNDFIFSLTKRGKRQHQCLKVLHDFTNKVIQELKVGQQLGRKETTELKTEDEIGAKKRMAFLDLLLQANLEGSSLTDEEIREEVDTFMFEGHDTTTSAISWTLFLLGLHPDIQEKVNEELDVIFQGSDRTMTVQDCQEMKYLEQVIKETLRLYPSVPFISRILKGDTKCGDYILPDGATILLHIYNTHRDPRHYPNPENFDPDNFLPERVQGRHPYAYVPFSAGPRNCIGQKFAMLEEKAMLATILRYFKIHSLEKREDLIPMVDLILRPKTGVQVILTRR